MTRSIAILVAAVALTAGAAQAQEVRISTAKLDLNTPHDAKVLYQQLVSAAVEVCGGYPRTIGDLELFDRCYRPALAAAVRQTNAPLVSAAALGAPTRVASR
jgi:UrcA family protein